MKNYVLHGENQPQLQKVLIQLFEQAKSQEIDVVRIDWKKSNENELRLSARSQGLISIGTLVVVDNFFTGNKKSLQIIKELPKDGVSYIFIENKTLSPGSIKALQELFTVQGFPVPTSIFNFLNSLIPRNSKTSIEQLKKVVEQDSDEFLLIMIGRHIKNLIWIKEDSQTFKGADWQKQRLLVQAKKFSQEQLRGLHTKLLELDRRNKSKNIHRTSKKTAFWN